MYSESIATDYTRDDDVASTISEGSEWGDTFAPWERQVNIIFIILFF